MRVRRLIATSTLGLGVLIGGAEAALAQASEDSPQVLPTAIEQTTTTAAPPTTARTQVRGEVLARTGQDLALPVLVGGSLAAGGAILVLGARKRRTA